jgi:hypothetical protein
LPTIIEYSTVLETLERSGLKCVYPFSGAFGLASHAPPLITGWRGGDDSTIHPEMLKFTHMVPAPAPKSLAGLLERAWTKYLTGPMWLMPASHWAFELQFGGVDWLPAMLEAAGIDPQTLRPLSDGSAIQFQSSETEPMLRMMETLFDRMTASDFTAAFPGKAAVALLHHHQQIWWQTSDRGIWESLEGMISF